MTILEQDIHLFPLSNISDTFRVGDKVRHMYHPKLMAGIGTIEELYDKGWTDYEYTSDGPQHGYPSTQYYSVVYDFDDPDMHTSWNTAHESLELMEAA